MSHTLVLGIGNTLLSDEGAGIHTLDYLQQRHPELSGVRYLDGGTLSFTLSQDIADADNLIVIDAAELKQSPGSICCHENEAMDAFMSAHGRSVHEVGLMDLMDIARLESCLPENRALIGIQPQTFGWGDKPSPVVAEAIPGAAQLVVELVQKWDAQSNREIA